jgi:Flp pilus assembly pilin Flp
MSPITCDVLRRMMGEANGGRRSTIPEGVTTMLSLYVKMQNKKAALQHKLADNVRNEDGEVSLEYALVGGLMAAAIIAGIGGLTGDLKGWFTSVGDKITASLN